MISIFIINLILFMLLIITGNFNIYKLQLLMFFIISCMFYHNKLLGTILFILFSIILYYKYSKNNIHYYNYFCGEDKIQQYNNKENNEEQKDNKKENEEENEEDISRDTLNKNQLNYIMETLQPIENNENDYD